MKIKLYHKDFVRFDDLLIGEGEVEIDWVGMVDVWLYLNSGVSARIGMSVALAE